MSIENERRHGIGARVPITGSWYAVMPLPGRGSDDRVPRGIRRPTCENTGACSGRTRITFGHGDLVRRHEIALLRRLPRRERRVVPAAPRYDGMNYFLGHLVSLPILTRLDCPDGTMSDSEILG